MFIVNVITQGINLLASRGWKVNRVKLTPKVALTVPSPRTQPATLLLPHLSLAVKCAAPKKPEPDVQSSSGGSPIDEDDDYDDDEFCDPGVFLLFVVVIVPCVVVVGHIFAIIIILLESAKLKQIRSNLSGS